MAILDQFGDGENMSLSILSCTIRNKLPSGKSNTKFFDEAGIKILDCSRNYGHSPVGERCVKVCRKIPSLHFTLSAMCSLNGIEYAKVINGTSNTMELLQFFDKLVRHLI